MLKAIMEGLQSLAASRRTASPPAAANPPLTLAAASPAGLKTGPNGIAMIKRFEGCVLKAYRCPANVLTIGYGSTGPHVTDGLVITEAQAEALLRKDLVRFEKAVNRHCTVGPTQLQFDALVSLAFNIGTQALQASTLLKRHNAGLFAEAGEQFLRWNRGAGRVLPGLTRRRAAERALYLKGS